MDRNFQKKVKFAESLKEKTKGMIGRNEPVFFKTRFGIHTFFMKFPINVYILDSENKVVIVKKNLSPWRVYFWNPLYCKVIETPANFEDDIKLGDKILL